MSLEEAITEMMARDSVLLATDFDGVIAPLVETPDSATPDPRAVELLAEMTGREGVAVVVVSGRALDDLSRRLGEIPGVILVGEHGNDLGETFDPPEVLADAREHLRWLHDLLPEAIVEQKPRSVSFHTRRLDRDQRNTATRAIREWVTGREGIGLLEGKEVFELTVATRTKGDAIGELADDFEGTIYMGDDVTDETVFEVLGPDDVGIKVGPGVTAANHRVADTEGVIGVLEQIASSSRVVSRERRDG